MSNYEILSSVSILKNDLNGLLKDNTFEQRKEIIKAKKCDCDTISENSDKNNRGINFSIKNTQEKINETKKPVKQMFDLEACIYKKFRSMEGMMNILLNQKSQEEI